MMNASLQTEPLQSQETPLCAYFGECGGCAYQHLTYEEELAIKQEKFHSLIVEALGESAARRMAPPVPSPNPYHYRHRLDITVKKHREGFLFGFQHAGRRKMIEIQSCAIAQKEVSDFLPELKTRVIETWRPDYRNANLVVRTGDDGRVLWGGMGRRSLEVPEERYLWTEIHGKRIYYSLDTFFQANLAILPALMEKIVETDALNRDTLFLDLYAGVGLFGIYFSDRVGELLMVEDSDTSVRVMQYNARYYRLPDSVSLRAKVEEALPSLLQQSDKRHKVAMIDPPRKGLHPAALQALAGEENLSGLFYLSCNPEALVRDLKGLVQGGWQMDRILPFDFFPRTVHLETLVYLKRGPS